MQLKVRTLHGAALAASLVTAVLCGVSLAVWGASWLYVTGSVAVVFGVGYLVARYCFTRFVLFRIKPIYQIMLAKNIKTNEMSDKGDFVGGIREEIDQWAEKNEREISRLQENEKYRKEFLGNVSHEIKTPIFTLQGYILTLLDGGLEDERVNRKYLERSEKSIDRLINIVQDLEEISKLESGMLRLDVERFDLVALTHEMVEAVEMEATRHRITIRVGVGISQAPVWVVADRKRIAQVLINLITNSLKYGHEGGETKIGFIDMFDRVMVEVMDNGVGMAADNLPRVFERFFRVDKSRSREQGGTGLGLAIVKHILEAHGQTITVRSALGEGSTFSFTLPVSTPVRN